MELRIFLHLCYEQAVKDMVDMDGTFEYQSQGPSSTGQEDLEDPVSTGQSQKLQEDCEPAEANRQSQKSYPKPGEANGDILEDRESLAPAEVTGRSQQSQKSPETVEAPASRDSAEAPVDQVAVETPDNKGTAEAAVDQDMVEAGVSPEAVSPIAGHGVTGESLSRDGPNSPAAVAGECRQFQPAESPRSSDRPVGLLASPGSLLTSPGAASPDSELWSQMSQFSQLQSPVLEKPETQQVLETVMPPLRKPQIQKCLEKPSVDELLLDCEPPSQEFFTPPQTQEEGTEDMDTTTEWEVSTALESVEEDMAEDVERPEVSREELPQLRSPGSWRSQEPEELVLRPVGRRASSPTTKAVGSLVLSLGTVGSFVPTSSGVGSSVPTLGAVGSSVPTRSAVGSSVPTAGVEGRQGCEAGQGGRTGDMEGSRMTRQVLAIR